MAFEYPAVTSMKDTTPPFRILQRSSSRAEAPGLSGRVAVLGLVIVIISVVGYFALGMPGMDHSTSSTDSIDHNSMMVLVRLSPREFAAQMEDPDALVVNVHVPDEGGVEGTDAIIAYDRIVGDARLPASKDTRILLYCRTGRMSESAGRALLDAGYARVSHLDGGMDAWERAGFTLARR